jgi:hypothetical protein
MGGHVFHSAAANGQPTLQTPRMSLEKYNELKQIYIQRLSSYFTNAKSIETAIEAPEKKDFGDIDILIFDDGPVDWAAVATHIGAHAHINRGNADMPACSLAVRLDGKKSTLPPVQYTLTSQSDPLQRRPSEIIDEEIFAQIDLNKFTIESYDWTMFNSSYGDLVGIIGMAITNLGFGLNDRGLRLRLQEYDDSRLKEWEHFNPTQIEGRIRLTEDPVKVMEFLGLDVKRYQAGFKSTEEVFQWVSESEFVSEYSLKREDTSPITREEKNVAREKERVMFTQFFETWLPYRLSTRKRLHEAMSGDDSDTEITLPRPTLQELRERYLKKALTFFDKSEEYASVRAAFLHKRNIEHATFKIRGIIAEHTKQSKKGLADSVKAFRRNVAFHDGKPIILDKARSDTDSALHTFLDASGKELQDPEGVSKWVGSNIDLVKQTERKRAREREAADTVLKRLDQAHQTIRGLAQSYTTAATAGTAGQGPDVSHSEALVQSISEYIAILHGVTGGAIDLKTLRSDGAK